jgi:DNA primase/ABC-type dipeptide/oligopeptide/nickel transport system ATPase component
MQISQIKQKLTITAVLAHYGIQPARDSHIKCPFHEDDKPSMKIYTDTNTYHCFGCGKTGDVIQFIQDKEQCSKHQAILKAKSMIPQAQAENPRPNKTPMESPQQPDYEALFIKFKQSLTRSQKARDYLKQRGLENFKEVGYNSSKFFDKLKHCIVFPLKDKNENVTSLYGRRINNSNPQYGIHYYTENRTGLYPSYPPKETEKLIITEAVIDAATLLQVPEITSQYSILSAYGTNGLIKEHKEAIKKLKNLKEIIFFFDGDTAGKEGIAKYSEELKELNCKITVVETPEQEDVNSMFVTYGKESILQLLNERKPIKEEDNGEKKLRNFLTSIEQFSIENKSFTNPIPELDTSVPHKIIFLPDRQAGETQTARYIVKGSLPKQLDKMLVSLDVQHLETGFKYRCRLDLYEEKQTRKEAREAAEKLELRSDLIEGDLSLLTDLLEEHRDKELQQKRQEQNADITLDPATQNKCRAFLEKPDLMERIDSLIEKSGIVGEENNRQFLFIIATSHKMPDTLHALIQGSSGSGKTHLLSKIAGLMPPERTIKFTRVTENSFYNYDEYFFKNKLICLEDIDGLKEEALFAWRELISNEQLSSSTSQKDENGNIRSAQRVVRGPMASICATTHGQIYEDNMSRLFIIAVDESAQQTGRIMDYQSRAASGIIDRDRERQARAFLQNCIRMLRPVKTVNPYADKIKLPPQAHKIRRLHELFLAFVRQITIINQYQRKKDSQGRLITTPEDLQTAVKIMFESIFLKIDELDGSLRQFFERLKAYIGSKTVPENYEFTQREVRHALNLSKTQLHRYINELIELEYIHQTGGYANRGYKYKIIYWDNLRKLRNEIQSFLFGQIKNLASQTDGTPVGTPQTPSDG